MAADASTEQRGIRNGQVKGEDKWTYERIDGARRTGETGEDATERWEYLIKWKGATKRTWERHRTIAAMGGVKLEALKEAQDTKLIPFSTRDRIERAATRGEAGMRAMLIAIDTWADTAGAQRPNDDTLTRMWITVKRHVEVASHSDEAGQRQDNIKESTRNESERDRHSSALPFRTLYLGKEPSTESDAADSDAQQKEKAKKTMALDGGGDEWRVAADGEATIGGDAWWGSDEPDTLGHGQEIDDLVGGGEWRRGAPQAVLDNVAMEEEIGGAVQEMWTKGGGRAGYEEIGRNEIARDPVATTVSEKRRGGGRHPERAARATTRPRGRERDCDGRKRVSDHARAGNEHDVEGEGPGVPPAQVAPLHSGGSDGRIAKEDSRRKASIIRGMGGRAAERGR